MVEQWWSCVPAQMAEQSVQGKAVAGGPEAADHTHSAISQKRVMAELFPGMGVAEMQFHIGDGDASQGIADGDGGVGVGPALIRIPALTPIAW